MIALIMGGMQNDQKQAKSAGRSRLDRASVCLFALGCFIATLYLAGVIRDGDHYAPILEPATALLIASWTAGAVHLRRISKEAKQRP
ncbi:hypothetical protein ACH4S8_04460 [Streptomyces sp. NPDC021080]|uniref:hypothetical protein n=1 Tax=Streptomyces sp. NPDC021080 TaxID=3365110 RepID=UPI0037A3BA58